MEGRTSGVEEYTLSLLIELLKLDSRNEYILFLNSFKKLPSDFSWAQNFNNIKIKRFRFPNKLINLCFWYLRWPKIDKLLGGVDIFFSPNIFFGSLSKKAKLITTFHDLSFERYPEFFSWKRRIWHAFINPKKIAEQSEKIIAISESTAKDLEIFYNIPSSKIKIIRNGCSENFRIIDRNSEELIKTKEKYGLPYKFILFLGTFEPRKNIVSIIRSFEELKKYSQKNNPMVKDYKLVLVGSQGWKSEKIFQEIEKSDFSEEIIYLDYIENEDRPYIYNLASLFVYPSFFEGFGLPAIEAMRSGTPVIAANNSSFPEVLENSAILVDPNRTDDVFLAMREIISSDKLKNSLIEKGIKKSLSYSWKKTAQKMLAVFNSL